ncbi:MAG: helix-turn-helix domain-containing protein [Pseudonocardiaceae bacterium]
MHSPAGWHCRRGLTDSASRSRPVSAVAARWGCPGPAHFCRVFRLEYGMPPGEYRQMRQNFTESISANDGYFPRVHPILHFSTLFRWADASRSLVRPAGETRRCTARGSPVVN